MLPPLREAGYVISDRGGSVAEEAGSGLADVKKSAERNHRNLVLLCLFLVPVLGYLWLVQHFGVNAIWYDQWDDVNVIAHPTLSTLWMQHNENRIFLPNLIVLILAHTTGFNIHVEEFLSALLAIGAVALIILAHRRRSPGTAILLYLPVAILMLSFAQWWNALFGFQLAWYLDLLCLAALIYTLDRRTLGYWPLAGAAAIAFAGSLSSLQGLLLWVVGLYLLFARRRPWGRLVVWSVCGVLTWVLYFFHYSSAAPGTNDSFGLHHLSKTVNFAFLLLGDLYGGSIPDSGHDPAVLAGGVVLAIIGIVLLLLWGFRRDETARPVGIALIIFGFLFAGTVAVGRVDLGPLYAASSRYTTFDMLVLVGCYLVLIDLVVPVRQPESAPQSGRSDCNSSHRPRVANARGMRFLGRGLLALVGILIVVVTVDGTKNGYSAAVSWNTRMTDVSRVMVNADHAPDEVVSRILWPNPVSNVKFVRQMDRIARQRHLSVFATATASSEAKHGLPPATHFMTRVLVPSSGSRMRGSITLGATGAYDIGPIVVPASRLNFTIDGPGGVTSVPAILTPYGWLGRWDSTKDDPGAYQIRSVAYDPHGHRFESPTVRVDVGG